MNIDPKKILLINFGQIGDVILSLSAMKAVRERFPDSELTLAVGKSSRAIVELCDVADEIIAVDRVAMRDSSFYWTLGAIYKLVRKVRKGRYDFVIDIHSLTETNLLGFLSGAKTRLFVKRANRSLDFLSNFRPEPPEFEYNLHTAEFYSRCLEPLGIRVPSKPFLIIPKPEDLETVDKLLLSHGLETKKLIGINFGAGSPSRLSSIKSFGELANRIMASGEFSVVVFAGPEEAGLRNTFYKYFPEEVLLLDKLTLKELAGAFTRLEVLVGNDSGPIHLATSVGARIVLIVGSNGQTTFIPITKHLRVVESDNLYEFDPDDVIEALSSLAGNETESL